MGRFAANARPKAVTLREAFWVWARIALLSFGGPAGPDRGAVDLAEGTVQQTVEAEACTSPSPPLVTVVLIALASFFAVMETSFTKIAVVLSLMRNALAAAMDQKISDMDSLSRSLDKQGKNRSPKTSTDLTVAGQEFGYLMSTTSTVIKTIGEGLNSMARKQ
ncbi:hypothetical protein [Sphingomonas elodea]|uniref:hypothetical protein n=1 Tax=Sphingomonas elodea TaxID=179878 RepID=UPI0002630287|nr:hypothetical protein [Sphingomonas elodea]